jgi:hypothetical protein
MFKNCAEDPDLKLRFDANWSPVKSRTKLIGRGQQMTLRIDMGKSPATLPSPERGDKKWTNSCGTQSGQTDQGDMQPFCQQTNLSSLEYQGLII